MTKPIDVHCHVFNKDVLTFRILFHLVESLIFAFIYRERKKADTKDFMEFIEELRKIYNFVKAGMKDSSVDVYNSLQEEYKKEYGQEFIVVPLTFDLYFAFKGSMRMKKKEAVSEEDIASFADDMKGNVQSLIKKIVLEKSSLSEIIDELKKSNSEEECGAFKEEMDTMLDFFKEKLENIVLDFSDIKLVGSFKRQLNEVQKLRKLHPEKVHPFLSADPRRFNIVNRIKKNVSANGPYYGVKVYAPNGYSPTDPDMMKIYEHCCDHNIPVTAHCSHGGFATFENTIRINGIINDPVKGLITLKNEKYSFDIPFLGKNWVDERASVLNDPDIWAEVLKKFPDLKLNLAHFGRWEEGYGWADKIYELMRKYKNVYTDFSCVSDYPVLQKYREYWVDASPGMRKRFMFGSDYYLNLLFAPSFNHYLSNFKTIFNNDEFNQLAVVNPRKFLGVEL
jgi:predicted TIM-barrel fold metal-dependent hydrolase